MLQYVKYALHCAIPYCESQGGLVVLFAKGIVSSASPARKAAAEPVPNESSYR
jgi:hypothetical protein